MKKNQASDGFVFPFCRLWSSKRICGIHLVKCFEIPSQLSRFPKLMLISLTIANYQFSSILLYEPTGRLDVFRGNTVPWATIVPQILDFLTPFEEFLIPRKYSSRCKGIFSTVRAIAPKFRADSLPPWPRELLSRLWFLSILRGPRKLRSVLPFQ